MSSTQRIRAIGRAHIAALIFQARRHRALTRASLATFALAVALAVSLQGAAAGPEAVPATPTSILPEPVAAGLATDEAVVIEFAEPMDPDSVAAAIGIRPATGWKASWSEDGRTLRLLPERRWRTDARYVVTVGRAARLADGRPAGATRQVSFTTQTAPTIADFQVNYVEETLADRTRADAEAQAATSGIASPPPPPDTAGDVSARTSITIGFSTAMDRADVERRFTISPEAAGELSWEGNALVFVPTERLAPGTRYAISVVGAHDERGNRLGGDASFSFTTRPGAQVVKLTPSDGAKDVAQPNAQVWFSQPMDTDATSAALKVEDVTGAAAIAGTPAWNDAGTQLTFTFGAALPQGHSFRISLGEGARDADGNAVTGAWTFSTKAAPPPPPAPRVTTTTRAAPPPPAAPPPADIQQFALWQVNQARAAYGFAPLVLDSAISSVASAYAWDLLNYGYFSHTGRDGSRVADRLRRAGISFSASGENLCYLAGASVRATLEWCHSTFMAEPYPGYFNHKSNILSPRFTRMGIGIASSGGRTKVVWNFAG